MDYDTHILNGVKTAFINEDYDSISEYKPKLIYNNNSGHKVLNSIKDKLHQCDEFYISVAFITMGGLTPLLQDFKELEKANIKGKILTTDYLNFSEPKALKKLNSFSNVEIKLYSQKKHGFHTKGYIFKDKNIYYSIIGSSNLTLNALTVNKEWNVIFTSLDNGEILNDIQSEFDNLWEESDNLNEVISDYETKYNETKKFKPQRENLNNTPRILAPNSMQKDFLKNLRELYKKGENKALLISATGTGKTYASAFAVKDFNPKKFLFIVHREQIAKQALKAYQKVFKNMDKKFGLLTGNKKDKNADYLFSTIQTLSKEEVYTNFNKDEFDYIIVDEVHKAGTSSYIKVLNYFQPKFYLGMSASPERTDEFNIYELFDYNVALNIRLQNALEQDLICPFHYFGIKDIEIDGQSSEDDLTDFNYLISSQRVNYLLEKSEYYNYSGDRVKALVFCSRKKEAKELSEEFNKRGHPSIALTGEDSQTRREDAIYRLTDDNAENKLEYIFTVDIFNEGVDIPEINQVLLVRPTQSSIIFIQQLGRGLRKYENKEYVVVLDFIGNYKNNFMIPIALSGDKTYDKDIIREYLMEGNRIIPGSSSISFDEVSKKRIYDSIDNASFSRISLFKEKYQNLKFKLGRIPLLNDFYDNNELDPLLILNHTSIDSYYSFLKKVDKEYSEFLSDIEVNYLKFISKILANGKRPHELLILKYLIYQGCFTINNILIDLKNDYNIFNEFNSIISSINILNLNFFVDKEKAKYDNVIFFKQENTDFSNINEKIFISKDFKQLLSHNVFYNHLMDLIDYSLKRYQDKFSKPTGNVNLKLFEKYSRKDVCRLLNWPHDDSSTLYGYRIKHNTCPIFVTYKKDEDISDTTKYQDEFINKQYFSWMTRSKIRLDSKEAQLINDYANSGLKIYLFIKKSDDEGKDFYYFGTVTPQESNQTTISDKNGKLWPIVNFKFKLDYNVRDDLFNYFIK